MSAETQIFRGGGSYALQAFAASGTPTDGATVYMGSRPSAAPGSVNNQRIYVPKSGIVRAAQLFFANTGLGSAETSTAAFWLNNTSVTTISSAITNDAAQTAFSNTALAIPVMVGDFFEIRFVWATWVTNPTVTPAAVILIEA